MENAVWRLMQTRSLCPWRASLEGNSRSTAGPGEHWGCSRGVTTWAGWEQIWWCWAGVCSCQKSTFRLFHPFSFLGGTAQGCPVQRPGCLCSSTLEVGRFNHQYSEYPQRLQDPLSSQNVKMFCPEMLTLPNLLDILVYAKYIKIAELFLAAVGIRMIYS